MKLRIISTTDGQHLGVVFTYHPLVEINSCRFADLQVKRIDDSSVIVYNVNYIMTCEEILG